MTDPTSESSSTSNLFGLAPSPIDRVLKPLQTFARHSLAGAGILVAATVLAVLVANSPWADAYHHLLETKIRIGVGAEALDASLHHWINDGLMSVFFFLVGLEIKRELLVGELASIRKATFPAIAAVGGMLVPAAIYWSLNPSGPASAGWAVPMATDIAFALGALALLGDRVPIGLKVFLTALAIVDDIGAVIVIAIFYTDTVVWSSLGFGIACIALGGALNAMGVRRSGVYLAVGVVAWIGFIQSGVHATIAAILMAFVIPARTRIDGEDLLRRMDLFAQRLRSEGVPRTTAMNTDAQQHVLARMAETIEHASAPLQRIEHSIAAPVAFVVLPVFAFANAGVSVGSDLGGMLLSPIALGIVLGLTVGKTAGITFSAWLAVKLGVADLPSGVSWTQVIGAATLAGIGFTMALFIASLAFKSPAEVETAKVGILAASMIAGVCGFVIVRRAT